MKKWILAAMLLLLTTYSSLFAIKRADQLLWACKSITPNSSKAMVDKVYCTGYISGLIDGYQILSTLDRKIRFICLPKKGISNDQANRIVIKWLEGHPKDLHVSAKVVVYDALKNSFPCGKR